jgi:endonuclease/exonuclease/phosphatase family metal-dependent hydrolase
LKLPGGRKLNAFVVHLKSKRPDWGLRELEDDPYQYGLATLRSLLRRGTEALGLRFLLTDHGLAGQTPLVVLGDFNEISEAVTSQIVMGSGWRGKAHFDERLYDCVRIQSHFNPLREVGFSHVHEGAAETIDHVLVSKEFYRHSPQAIGEVVNVQYLNEHLALRPAATSDHGQVLVRVHLYGPDEQDAHTSIQNACGEDADYPVDYTASGFFGADEASSSDSSASSASSADVPSAASPSSPG